MLLLLLLLFQDQASSSGRGAGGVAGAATIHVVSSVIGGLYIGFNELLVGVFGLFNF